jgi:prefoldin subunit 5
MTTESALADVMRAIGRLEGQQEQMNARMLELSQRLDQRMLELNQRIDTLNQRMDKLIFSLFGVGGAIAAGLIAIGVKVFLG